MAEKKTLRETTDLSTELRLVLVGPVGNGKSATGNTILGRRTFKTHIMATSQDDRCHCANTVIDGQKILVVDTPGLFYCENEKEDNREKISREIAKCVLLSAPGPHAILLVLGLNRLSRSLQRATRLIEDMFGTEAKRYIIIVLTGKDDMEDEEETLEGYIANVPSYMVPMFKRFPAFAINNSSGNNSKQQTKELLKLVAERNSEHMSNAFYESIEEILLRAEGESVL